MTLTWDTQTINACREKINACCSQLMFASNTVASVNPTKGGAKKYAGTLKSIKGSTNATAKILLSIKAALLADVQGLDKADEKSEKVISEMFDRYFSQGIGLDNPSFFNQLDYGDIPYAKNNVQKGGCGITCLAGLFTDLFGTVITPADLAGEYSGDKKNGGTSDKQMIQIANDYGVEVEKYGWTAAWGTKGEGKVMEALKNGQQVVMCVRNCAFTKGGHYIRLTGLTEDGKIIVHDPNGENWTKPNLKDGFENGFEPKFMSQQGGSAFIFENPEKSTEKSTKQTQSTKASLKGDIKGKQINKRTATLVTESVEFDKKQITQIDKTSKNEITMQRVKKRI